MSEIIISISGMTCPHCVGRAQKALEKLDAVTDVKVTLDPSQAIIQGNVEVNLIIEAVETAGYQAELLS